MIKYCPFDERHRCYIWIDHAVIRYIQAESGELLQANWNEIVFLLDRVCILEDCIKYIDETVPPIFPNDNG